MIPEKWIKFTDESLFRYRILLYFSMAWHGILGYSDEFLIVLLHIPFIADVFCFKKLLR